MNSDKIKYICECRFTCKKSLWNASNTKKIFQEKWKHNDINSIYDLDESKTIYKLLPEKKYDYDIGKSNKNIIFKDRTYTRSFDKKRDYFFKNVKIIEDYSP